MNNQLVMEFLAIGTICLIGGFVAGCLWIAGFSIIGEYNANRAALLAKAAKDQADVVAMSCSSLDDLRQKIASLNATATASGVLHAALRVVDEVYIDPGFEPELSPAVRGLLESVRLYKEQAGPSRVNNAKHATV